MFRQGFLQRLDAELGLHRYRDPMRQNPPTEHIDDCREIDEASGHCYVGDVYRPHVIGGLDLHAAQQIGVDLVTRSGLLVFGRRSIALIPIRFISVAICRRPIETQFVQLSRDFQGDDRHGP